MADLAKRFLQNPIITPADISPSRLDMEVVCVMNPGVFLFDEKTWLVLRVAERPLPKPGRVSIPVMDDHGRIKIISYPEHDPKIDCDDPRYIIYDDVYYLSTISHLMLVSSADGVHFTEPPDYPTRHYGTDHLESYGIEDCRVTELNGSYLLTYSQVSAHGVGVGLMQTKDWKSFDKTGMAFLPTNKDCAIFGEKIDNKYFCFSRPSSSIIGGHYIWLSSSPDLAHWGDHYCLLKSRPGMWDSERVGAGAAPIRTKEGWLAIYHGADETDRYCLGAILLDLKDPRRIIARSDEPIMEPIMEYERAGFFGNVIFSTGHLVNGDIITMYYGASDMVVCMANLSIQEILDTLSVQ